MVMRSVRGDFFIDGVNPEIIFFLVMQLLGNLHSMRASSEVVLDLSTTLIGGDLKRNIVVTRFLRAAGPVQTSVGWRVEPSMGFIVDITAVS